MEETAMFANTQVATVRVIHTPSTFARENLLHLQETGMLRALAPHVSRRENLPSYLCFLVTAGAGSLSYGGRTYTLGTGDCVFLDCRRGYAQATSAHRDGAGNLDELWSLQWVHFDGPTMAGIYEKYQERGGQPVFSCTADRGARYGELLRSLLTLASSDSYVRDMEIAARLTELLTCLMEDAWKPEPDRNKSGKRLSLTRIRGYIGEHYREKLPDVAKHASRMERRADEAERETNKLKKAEYMAKHIGERYEGVISGITQWGIYVELANTVEGMIHVSTLPGDYYYYDETVYEMVGRETGRRFKLGEILQIRVKGVDRFTRTVDFLLDDEEETEEQA